MISIRKVVLIGSGNVATHLGLAFKQAGIQICGVYSKTYSKAETLAVKLETDAYKTFNDIPKDVDAYLLAVSDSALPTIIDQLTALKGVLMHTSGM